MKSTVAVVCSILALVIASAYADPSVCPKMGPYHQFQYLWVETYTENGHTYNFTGSGLTSANMISSTSVKDFKQRMDYLLLQYDIDGVRQTVLPWNYRAEVAIMDEKSSKDSRTYAIEYKNGTLQRIFRGSFPPVPLNCTASCEYKGQKIVNGINTNAFECLTTHADPSKRIRGVWYFDARWEDYQHGVLLERFFPDGRYGKWEGILPFIVGEEPWPNDIFTTVVENYKKIEAGSKGGDDDDSSSDFWNDNGGAGIWLVIISIFTFLLIAGLVLYKVKGRKKGPSSAHLLRTSAKSYGSSA